MMNHFQNILKKLEVIDSFKLIMNSLKEINNLELNIAGGVVRNYFIDNELEIKDIDLFYKGNIEPLLEIMEKNGVLDVGPFGSLRWFPLNSKIYYDIISIERFNNGVEKCSTITDVLNQFDFTANSIAYRLNDGHFYSPCNGLKDIEDKVIKMVRFDYPDEMLSKEINISRNSILWFRILHYASKLNFDIDVSTNKWLLKNKAFYKDLDKFTSFFFIPTLNKDLLNEFNLD
ncbi:hypothetical protein [Flavobacterium sp. WC2509]|uniref:hypothetical protein n=1 Tax=Flavobacterium sp. WC2509 TaxID=3461406 RepID=UPI0040450AD7